MHLQQIGGYGLLALALVANTQVVDAECLINLDAAKADPKWQGSTGVLGVCVLGCAFCFVLRVHRLRRQDLRL